MLVQLTKVASLWISLQGQEHKKEVIQIQYSAYDVNNMVQVSLDIVMDGINSTFSLKT